MYDGRGRPLPERGFCFLQALDRHGRRDLGRSRQQAQPGWTDDVSRRFVVAVRRRGCLGAAHANTSRMLPARPLLASSSSAVPPVCSARDEFFAMPEAGVAVLLGALPLDDDPLALVELETTGGLTGGG